MKILLIRKHELTTTHWSGGTSTQLAIYPPEATYAERNFTFRLSTATVELDESVFTALPGVSRILMLLQGKLTVIHPGRYSRTLEKMQLESFEGDWGTVGKGNGVIDFNVMTRAGAEALVYALTLEPEGMAERTGLAAFHTVAYYMVSGKVELDCPSGRFGLEQGDFVMLHRLGDDDTLTLTAKQASELVEVGIELTH